MQQKQGFFYKVLRRFFLLFRPAMNGRIYNNDGKRIPQTRISNTTYVDHPQHLLLGENVYIGHYNFIEASNGITIEEGCQLTTFINMTSHSSHMAIRIYGRHYSDVDKEIYERGSIFIGKYTFVGPHSTIMPKTKIGKGSLIAAYSYVKGEFPDFSIISGNPAKVIGDTRAIDERQLSQHPELRSYYDEWTKDH
jgi:acetyltransferase-like isoleucine patch superfamily enzyme